MTTLALEYFRSAPRYLGARTVGTKAPGLLSGPLAPLRLVNIKDPEPPTGHDGWATVKPLLAGICGSDLATIAGKSSFYFSPLVSTPFVPGHEIVGELTKDCDDLPLLRTVGNPVAVSPDSALYRHARRRRWPIEPWEMSRSMPKVRFPKPAVR